MYKLCHYDFTDGIRHYYTLTRIRQDTTENGQIVVEKKYKDVDSSNRIFILVLQCFPV